MQSHRNQVHRLILIDRVLQRNTFDRPEGVEIDHIKQSVQDLLNDENGAELTSQTFEELWRGKDAFRKDLKFILTHYPTVLEKLCNKVWRYRERGLSLFPRFGSFEKDRRINDLILPLDYFKDHPLAKDLEVESSLDLLKGWFEWNGSGNPEVTAQHFNHQFASEDSDTFTRGEIQTLYKCLGRNIVTIKYESSRDGTKRCLEIHPWEFHQSEGRWYVTGYISNDNKGNYPTEKRTDSPGIALKLTQIQSVARITDKEIAARIKNRAMAQSRHTFIPREEYPLLDFKNRIGIGGWDNSLVQLKKQKQFEIKFRLGKRAISYFESSSLCEYATQDGERNKDGWTDFTVRVDSRQEGRRKRSISTLNRELIAVLRSFGDQIEVLEPAELRKAIEKNVQQTIDLYRKGPA